MREAVLALRRQQGMVTTRRPRSVCAGSFFTNPVLGAAAFAELEERAREWLGDDVRVPRFEQGDGAVKTPAWLIEHAGFERGHGDPATVAISGKHTLALTNRGAGTTAQLVALAREIAAGVRDRFGVELGPSRCSSGTSGVATSAQQVAIGERHRSTGGAETGSPSSVTA